MTIKGGTFTNTATTQVTASNGNGGSSRGYALAVIGHDGYQPVDVTVTGGTFNGVVDCKKLSGSNEPKLTITGGTFENDISEYATAGSTHKVKDYIAEVGGKQYRSLPQAIGATTDTDNTIKMIANTDLAYSVLVDKNVTLDLNGNTISYVSKPDARAILIQPDCKLTVKDSGTNGTIKASLVGIECDGEEGKNAELVVESGNIETGCYAIFPCSYSTVTVNGGTFKNTYGDVYTNGTHTDVNLTINNGTFSSGMYLAAGNSTYTINNGTFSIENPDSELNIIEIKGGKLTINDGKFVNKAKNQVVKQNGNGGSTSGYVLSVVGQVAYSDVNVNVKGGSFDGKVLFTGLPASAITNATDKSITLKNTKAEPKNITATISLSGGNYTDDISKYVADDYVALKKDGKYNVTALKKTETKATAVSDDDAAKITEDLTTQEGTTEKIDTFELSGIEASFVRAAYPITGAKNDTVNVDFDMSNVENLGNAKFGVLFYNIPAGITVGDAVISVAK